MVKTRLENSFILPVWVYWLAGLIGLMGGVTYSIDAYISNSVLPANLSKIPGLTAVTLLMVVAVEGAIIYLALGWLIRRRLSSTVSLSNIKGRNLLLTILAGVVSAIGQGISLFALQTLDPTIVTVAGLTGVINLGLLDMVTMRETSRIKVAIPYIAFTVIGAIMVAIKGTSLSSGSLGSELLAVFVLVICIRNSISAIGFVVERAVNCQSTVKDGLADKFTYTMVRFMAFAVTAVIIAIGFCLLNNAFDEMWQLLKTQTMLLAGSIAILSVVGFFNNLLGAIIATEMPVVLQAVLAILKSVMALILMVGLDATLLPRAFGVIAIDSTTLPIRLAGLVVIIYCSWKLKQFFGASKLETPS